MAADSLFGKAVNVHQDPTQSEIDDILQRASGYDTLVLLVYNMADSPNQKNLLDQLLETEKPVVVICAGSPHDLQYLNDAPTVLCTYGYTLPRCSQLSRYSTEPCFRKVNCPWKSLKTKTRKADDSQQERSYFPGMNRSAFFLFIESKTSPISFHSRIKSARNNSSRSCRFVRLYSFKFSISKSIRRP